MGATSRAVRVWRIVLPRLAAWVSSAAAGGEQLPPKRRWEAAGRTGRARPAPRMPRQRPPKSGHCFGGRGEYVPPGDAERVVGLERDLVGRARAGDDAHQGAGEVVVGDADHDRLAA